MLRLRALASFIFLCLLSVSCLAERSVLEAFPTHHVPVSWTWSGFPAPEKELELSVALKIRNADKLEETFWAVSTPRSPEYGKHLSLEELGAMISPSETVIEKVQQWLEEGGAYNLRWTINKEFVRFTIPVARAESLLQTKLALFTHQSGRTIIRATQAYSVPSEVAPYISLVSGLYRFPPVRPLKLFSPYLSSARFSVQPTQNNPVVLSSHQGASQMQFFWAVICYDGQPATDPTTPCTPASPVIAFELDAFANDVNRNSPDLRFAPPYQQGEQTNYGYSMFCDQGSALPEPYLDAANTSYGLNAVYCIGLFNGFRDYVPYNVALRTIFANQLTSQAWAPPVPLTTLPWTTVQLLREQYNVPSNTKNSNPHNSQAVIEFLGEWYNQTDLSLFLRAMGQEESPVHVIGENNQAIPGFEASLDIQYMIGLSTRINTTFWFDGRYNDGQFQEPFLDWLLDLANMTNPPLVMSLSYDDQEYSLSPQYMDQVNIEFQKAGARGLSLLFAAGDDGVGGYDARNGSQQFCNPFSPTFPGGSPYVTSVDFRLTFGEGGTQLSATPWPVCTQTQNSFGQTGFTFVCSTSTAASEIVCSTATGARITTGGGFSWRYSRPAYQDAFVSNYLSQTDILPPANHFNASGRGYPDISANAHNYVVWVGGAPYAVDGTSASTPVVAALIALINDARLNIGKSPLGFLNPWLYDAAARHPQAFNDIVLGDNRCTADFFYCCQYGFNASRGWDPVTGLGTPNFLYLRNIALSPDQPYPDAQYVYSEPKTETNARIGFIVAFAVIGAILLVMFVLLIVALRRKSFEYSSLQ